MVQKPVKVDEETLTAITEKYPDLKDEADAVKIRNGVNRLILECAKA